MFCVTSCSKKAVIKLRAWLQFIKERFEPVSHLAMIGLFFLAHRVAAAHIFASQSEVIPIGKLLSLSIGVLAFFFKLRLYDEIKDYELDVKINPTRPLARGLLLHKDLKIGIGVCIFLELATFSIFGVNALVAVGIAIGYSLLMYNEFFIPKLIRPLLTTYALTHTIVCSMLSVAIFTALSGGREFCSLPLATYYFSLANWFLFNIFEFGRKTFATNEEREGVESYSKIFGRLGAVILVLSQALVGNYLLTDGAFTGPALYLWIGSSVLVLSGLVYFLKNTPAAAKFYRGFSSAYIVIILLIYVASNY